MDRNNATPEEVVHSQAGARGAFHIERDGRRVAELTYTLSGDKALVDHTFVEPAFRGGTLAPSLVEAAVRWARDGNRKIVPLCSYVRSVFARTRAYDDVKG